MYKSQFRKQLVLCSRVTYRKPLLYITVILQFCSVFLIKQMQPWWAEETSTNMKSLPDPRVWAYIALYFFISHRTEIQSWLRIKAATLALKTLLMSPAWISLRRMKPLFLRTLAFPSLSPSDRRTLRPTLSGIPRTDREAVDIQRSRIWPVHTAAEPTNNRCHTVSAAREDYMGNIISYRLLQERSQKGDSGCASEKLGVPHLSD